MTCNFRNITANVPCGDHQTSPNCSMCPQNNHTILHSWCSGYCTFDIDNNLCIERSKFLIDGDVIQKKWPVTSFLLITLHSIHII